MCRFSILESKQEFLRIKELLKVIEKSDALYSSVINRYCIITAECADFEKRIEKLKERLERLEADYDNEKIQPDFYYSKLDSLQKSIIGYDRQIMTKPIVTGKQSLPEDDVRIKKDEFLHNFNESKKRRLEDNEKEGKEYRDWETDRKSTRLNSSHEIPSRMPSSA